MPDLDGKTHALVLSGGGAHGAFEVGVMKALFEGRCASTNHQPLDADIFCGTSVGSVNSAFMTSQPGRTSLQSARDLERFWLDDIADEPTRYGNRVFRFRADLPDFFNVRGLLNNPIQPFGQLADDAVFFARDWLYRAANFVRSKDRLENRVLELVNLSSFITVEPLRKLLKEKVSMEGIRNNDKQLRIIVTNWESGEVSIFANQDMTEKDGANAVMASAAIPGIFPPVDIRGEPNVDGGVVMNTPLVPAMLAGADVVHMIYMDPDIKSIPLDRLNNTMDTVDRMLAIQFAININRDVRMAQRINRGLKLIEEAKSGSIKSSDAIRDFIHAASLIKERIEEEKPFRPVTIHRYRPREELGGALGMLNFKPHRVREMISAGEEFAVEYDPAAESVLPD